MKVLLSLVLLLSVLQDSASDEAHVPPEVRRLWDELSGLKELVLSLKAAEVERRQTLRDMESRLREQREESEQQRRRLEQLQDLLLLPGSGPRRRVENLEQQSRGGPSTLP